MTNAELNEEIKGFVAEYGYERSEDILLIAIVARHFAEWGMEQASGSSEIPNGLEEAAEKYAYEGMPDEMKSYVKPVGDEVIKNFIAGAKWQAEQLLKSSPLPEDTVLYNKGVEEGKRLMMEEAVEGEYGYFSNASKTILPSGKLNLKEGDKVRIIIVKEDEK